tara:strand:- start:8 stop:292 length:285 start_codon:yes stop_codon:yes gene_type:complete
MHAKCKLNEPGMKGKRNYAARKKLGVERALKYIEANEAEDIKSIFKKAKKKDDLADTLLLILSYLDRPTPRPERPQRGLKEKMLLMLNKNIALL